jgi:putative phosphoesterase
MKSLILADIHANLPALEAVFDQEGDWDELIVLGDLIVAGPYPEEVVSLLAHERGVLIRGNHDQEALEIDLDAPQPDPHRAWTQWTRRQLSERNYEFLASLPDTCAIERDGMSLRLVHGRFPRDLGHRLWPDSPPEQFEAIAKLYPEEIILFGHVHVQFQHVCHHTKFINPGTVGAPYMGQPLSCYAVLQDGQFDLKATPFDADRVCRAMDERVPLSDVEFVEGWKDCWRTGELPPRYFIRDYAPLREMGYR